MPRPCRLALLGLSLLAVLLAVPAPSSARTFETIIQDDALALHRSDQQTDAFMARLAGLGVTRLRVTAVWKEIAPAGDRDQRPDFDAGNPDAYGDRFRNLDRAIRKADAHGLQTMIDIGFFAPLWAADETEGADRGVTNVNPAEFASFAAAVARRYDGNRTAADGLPLPRVQVLTLWNEPNHPGFAQPQWQDGVAVAADWYRRLIEHAYPAIKAVAPDSTVLIGATSSGGDDTGQNRSAVAPLAFTRRLACVDKKLRPVRDGACATFTTVPGDGFSHHPYGLKLRPSQRSRKAGWVTMSEVPDLARLLDRLAARGRLATETRNIWLTEYGYEDNETVSAKPWSAGQQAQLLPWAERLAWQVPTVRSYPQFLLGDIETQAAVALAASGSPRRAAGSWQTGLFTEDGVAKPAAASFRLALDVTYNKVRRSRTTRRVTLWGHVRPADGPVRVQLQLTRDRGGHWQTAQTKPGAGQAAAGEFLSGPEGVFRRSVTVHNATGVRYRLLWQSADGSWEPGPAMMPHRP